MLRILLFLATNLAIVVLLGVVMFVLQTFFGIRLGRDTGSLLVIASILGFGGSFISLALSKWMAKKSTGAQVITEPRNEAEKWLVDTVRRQAQAAGIGMPEVAVYPAPEMNAFATGMNKNKALVAVSTGLLQSMDRREVEAVLAHEVSHIANGDMVTLALIQGIVNTFVFFLARVVGNLVDSWLRGGREGGGGIGYFVTVIVCEIVFGIFATMIVAWFSRRREFRADAGSATLQGRESMIAALQRLGQPQQIEATTLPKAVQAFGISGPIGKLFSTHPPIEARIAALRGA
jgi:heat shock protein HtpX